MPCGCGGGAASKSEFVYTTTKGVQKTYKTEIEAKAAQIRHGGGGAIREVAKT